jgi:hypothetical protein
MAKRRPIFIDGILHDVEEDSTLDTLVEPEVQSVTTCNGELIPRSQFDEVAVPDGFETNLSEITKG